MGQGTSPANYAGKRWVYTKRASFRCSLSAASRLPGGPHSAQPPHFSHLHFFAQGFAVPAHQDLQTRSKGVVEPAWSVAVVVVPVVAKVTVGVVVAVTEAVLPVVVMLVTVAVLLAVVVAHDRHPPQQSQVHLKDQLSELCAQKGLHSPTFSVLLVVVTVTVDGAGVGEVPGTHCA